ncbi:MAG: thiamine pyrophosphate-dependent enzyme [Prevotellaceae bacterium]|nr:thiamine pyrophosphate-dependent enzyme [Prevotellaceae bacterium]
MDKQTKLLLGDEAIALGALHAGLGGVYAYPGTPSTEITEYIQGYVARNKDVEGIHTRWCTNEKTAMEAALGMSYAGKRALVCMKHVGMNVCADAFVNSAVTGVNGGVVVLAADDPSMHSSQNEQDSRFYGKFALVPVFEPSNQQEAYDMMKVAFEYSESIKEPVLMRMVTRLAHSRANVEVDVEKSLVVSLLVSNDRSWVLLPAIARRQYVSLLSKQPEMLRASETSQFNTFAKVEGCKTGIIACGIAYNYVREVLGENTSGFSILKVSQYPLPEKQIVELAKSCTEIIVIEDGQPVVEEGVKVILQENGIADCKVTGRLTGKLPRTGELNPDSVGIALIGKHDGETESKSNVTDIIAARPPQLCPGCGHRDVYAALKLVASEYPDYRIFGDIGCYTLGALPPFQALASTVDMGASITMAKGAADAGLFPSIAVIGDSTFTHSGMTGLLDAVNDKSNITVVISDNLTTGMTGGQDSAGTSKYEAICLGLGVEPEHLHVVVPLEKNMDEITKIIRDEINYYGVSVIIPRRECIQTLRRHAKAKKQ